MNDIQQSSNESKDTAKTIAFVVYALQVLAFINGITAIIGVVINYVKLDDVKGTWLESHFRWQIRTFWFGLLWAVVGVVTIFIFVGFIILFADLVWIIYRIVKGWLCLNEYKPVGVSK
ncbi:MAG: hypothetical protein PVI75_05370 [Gammaproteobacteria bacterium]|jgi:uncharacterized membrane protein